MVFGLIIRNLVSPTHLSKLSISASIISQKLGWSMSKTKTPGDGSDIIFLKLSSVFSFIALRKAGTKHTVGTRVYNSL
jgi:hypothetical protein